MNKNIYIDTQIDDLVISVKPKELNSKLQDTILNKIKEKYGNKCYKELGYILKNSLIFLKNDLIKITGSSSNALMTCSVSVQCTLCCPHIGSVIKCHIIDKIENAYLAYFGPLIIFIRRTEENHDLNIHQIVEVEIVMVRYNENSINIFANFKSVSEELNYYEIPQTSSDIIMVDTIQYISDIQEYTYMEKAGYSTSLNEKKQEINNIKNVDWSDVRNIINPYELVFPQKKYNISVINKTAFYEPINNLGRKDININNMINRAYFKMWEILHDKKEDKWGNMLQKYKDQNIVVLGIAEAPGGFLQAIMDTRIKQIEDKVDNDVYRGISLENEEDKIQWNAAILEKYKTKFNIDLAYGYGKNNGDIRTVEEQQFIKDKLLENKKAHLIVADGGIDVSKDYYTQEVQNHKLFYSEIIIALSNQEIGGNFVMKCYDLYTVLSIQYLTILKNYYDQVYIIKPDLSRPANSEKYIVAMNYNGKFSNVMEDKSTNMISRWNNEKMYILEILTTVDSTIMSSMKHINEYFSNRQISFIDTGLDVSKKISEENILQKYKENQTKESKKWCEKFDIPIINAIKK